MKCCLVCNRRVCESASCKAVIAKLKKLKKVKGRTELECDRLKRAP